METPSKNSLSPDEQPLTAPEHVYGRTVHIHPPGNVFVCDINRSQTLLITFRKVKRWKAIVAKQGFYFESLEIETKRRVNRSDHLFIKKKRYLSSSTGGRLSTPTPTSHCFQSQNHGLGIVSVLFLNPKSTNHHGAAPRALLMIFYILSN